MGCSESFFLFLIYLKLWKWGCCSALLPKEEHPFRKVQKRREQLILFSWKPMSTSHLWHTKEKVPISIVSNIMVSDKMEDRKPCEQGRLYFHAFPQAPELEHSFEAGWPYPNESCESLECKHCNDCPSPHAIRAAEGTAQICFWQQYS